MARTKRTNFHPSWLSNYSWIKEASVKWEAFCKLCQKQFSLSNMGENAIISHANGKGHKAKVKDNLLGSIHKHFKQTQNSTSTAQVAVHPTSALTTPSSGKNIYLYNLFFTCHLYIFEWLNFLLLQEVKK